jgi:UDP-glucose 4-epimerase
MRILFTGASSFTGFWFVRELSSAGHDVTAVFRRSPDAYEGVRAKRVHLLADACRPIYECSFGAPEFLELLDKANAWDVLCHHAAEVGNYKSPDFDVVAAVANNTRNLPRVLDALLASGCNRVLLTGSVFEPNEGAGSDGLPAFSPYGLSKGLTAEIFRYYAAVRGMRLGKFVIPNPFGPYEEPRFAAYLMRTWLARDVATVKTPAYVRDNIHVSLLAKAYVRFVEALTPQAGFNRIGPSGYVENQGAFAQRFAAEMRPRLNLPCELELQQQMEFGEPRIRINTDTAVAYVSDWDEGQAWDELALHYQRMPPS